MDSVLNVKVSFFKNCFTSDQPREVDLIKWLTSSKLEKLVMRIREARSKGERDKLKKRLPAITPSGLFKSRRAGDIITHTGLLAIDIDLDEQNKEIANWDSLKAQVIKIPNIAYFGLSVSGKGYWGLIPIEPNANRHGEYFDFIYEVFARMGISLDKACRDVSRLRYYSYDSDAYFNHQAIPLRLQVKTEYSEKQKLTRTASFKDRLQFSFGNQENAKSRAISQVQSQIDQITDTPGHPRLRSAARLMGGYVAAGLIDKLEGLDILDYLIEGNAYLSQKTKIKGYKRTALQALEHGMFSPIYPNNQGDFKQPLNWDRYLPSKVNPKVMEEDKSSKHNYILGLFFENSILINEDQYPALWDTTANCPHIDTTTKKLLEQIVEDPDLLEVLQEAYRRKIKSQHVSEVH